MKTIEGTVTVTYKEGGEEKEKTAPVSYSEFETAEDILEVIANSTEADGKPTKSFSEFLSNLNYGTNLKARSQVRATLLQSLPTSPDKAIEAFAKQLVKMRAAFGKPITLEQAMVLAKAQSEELSAA